MEWRGRTAKDPGAFLAAVQPQPLYSPNPSSRTILTTPRPRKASGFVWRLILRTSRGRRIISPIPITLHIHQLPNHNISPRILPVPSCTRRHHGLASFLAKGILERRPVVLLKVIADKGLSSILVHSLQNLIPRQYHSQIQITRASDLVSRSISETWEEGEELATSWRGSLILEDDLVQLSGGDDLIDNQQAATYCKPFPCDIFRTFPWLLINRFAIVSTLGELAISPSSKSVRAYRMEDSKLSNSSRPYKKSITVPNQNFQSCVTHLILIIVPASTRSCSPTSQTRQLWETWRRRGLATEDGNGGRRSRGRS